jgi:hypothetical protein
MDVATIVITASSIIIILQVVSIILIAKNKKNVVEKVEVPLAQPTQTTYEQKDFRKRREDNRFNRRPPVEQKPKPAAPQQPQAVDYVEKSLRDINLRLKNAERDQENARKKIRDVIQSPAQGQGQNPNQNQQRRFENNQNRPSRPRDDDFRRRDRQGRPNNNQFRDNRDRDRDRDQNRPPEMERPVDQTTSTLNAPVSAPIREAVQPQPITPAQVQPIQPIIEKEVIAAVPENTEILHGRKVLVRRRILTPEEQAAKDRESAASDAPVPETSSVGAVASQAQSAESKPAAPPENEGESEPIRFGR